MSTRLQPAILRWCAWASAAALALAVLAVLPAGPAASVTDARSVSSSLGVSRAPAARDPLQRCSTPALADALRVSDPLPRIKGLGAGQVRRVAQVVRAGTTSRAQAIAVMTYLAVTDPKASPARLGVTDLAVRPFYRDLTADPAWATLAPSVAAHRATGSPDPYVFEDYWTPAVVLTAKLAGVVPADLTPRLASGASADRICRAPATAPRGFPLPAGTGYSVVRTPASTAQTDVKAGKGTSKPGRPGKSAPDADPSTVLVRSTCGTPVTAASSGVVGITRDRRSAGPWLITVARDGVSTTYAHVGRPSVQAGRPVVVGDTLATVGDFGDVDDCALGFSVTTRSRTLAPAQAMEWLRPVPLAPKPLKKLKKPAAPPPDLSRETTSFRMATYNVLGHHLTARGGSRPGFAPGTTRMANGLGYLEGSGASVVAFQEFESPQAGVVLGDGDWGLQRATPNDRFRDGTDGGNAVAWRLDTWELVDSTEFTVPYRYPLHMPVVHLRNLQTGGEMYVVGVHNPATTAKQGDQAGARAAARAEEKRQVLALEASTDLPVIIAGDMNERGPAKCDFNAVGIVSAGGCSGGYNGVDQIFGAGDVAIADITPDNRLLGGVSDHPLVTSGITLHP